MTQTDIGMKATLIRFEPELLARLRALADHNQMSVAALVRHIIAEWLAGRGAKY